jgi:hypothetical protein
MESKPQRIPAWDKSIKSSITFERHHDFKDNGLTGRNKLGIQGKWGRNMMEMGWNQIRNTMEIN